MPTKVKRVRQVTPLRPFEGLTVQPYALAGTSDPRKLSTVDRGLCLHQPNKPDRAYLPVTSTYSQADQEQFARMIVNADAMLAVLRDLADGFGYQCDADACECGVNGTGLDDDGKPCVHILVHRAIAAATGQPA